MSLKSALRILPVASRPTTCTRALPLNVALPSGLIVKEPGVTLPCTSICSTSLQGPKGKPPDRPAITHWKLPPADVAPNPSCEVSPKGPSTTPPPTTLASDALPTEGSPSMSRPTDTAVAIFRVRFMCHPPRAPDQRSCSPPDGPIG